MANAPNRAAIARQCHEKFGIPRATVETSMANFLKDSRSMQLSTAGPIADILGLTFAEPGSSIDAAEVLGNVGFATYVSELDSGRLVFVSDALLCLLGFNDRNELLRAAPNAVDLYVDDTQRIIWRDELLSTGKTSTLVELRRRNSERRLFVLDIAVAIHDESHTVVGLLVDVTREVVGLRNQENYVRTLHEILDHQWINLCLHEVHRDADSEPRIGRVNIPERQLLGIPLNTAPKDLRFSGLAYVPTDDSVREEERIQDRVKQKLDQQAPLNKDVFRTFVKPSSLGTATPVTVPVSISDFGVVDAGSVENRYGSLLTVVRDVRIPPDVAQLLRELGAKYPPLCTLKVSTMIKARVSKAWPLIEPLLISCSEEEKTQVRDRLDRHSSEDKAGSREESIVFVYGNKPFLDRLKNSTGETVTSLTDLMGLTESELFNEERFGKETAALFRDADRYVLEHNEEYQRTENHPLGNGESVEVQVLKTPLHVRSDPRPVGLQVFFWDIEPWGGSLVSKMRELTSAKEVLDLVPLPIYRKDSERRFVYANPGYLKDISEGSSRETGAQREFALHDVIGMTDRDIFPADIAAEYERDDKVVLESGEEIQRVEAHFDRKVRVIKTPVFSPPESAPVGVQGVFWYLED